jgi:hypothetical protein
MKRVLAAVLVLFGMGGGMALEAHGQTAQEMESAAPKALPGESSTGSGCSTRC